MNRSLVSDTSFPIQAPVQVIDCVDDLHRSYFFRAFKLTFSSSMIGTEIVFEVCPHIVEAAVAYMAVDNPVWRIELAPRL